MGQPPSPRGVPQSPPRHSSSHHTNGGQSLTIAGNLSSDNVRSEPNSRDPATSECTRIARFFVHIVPLSLCASTLGQQNSPGWRSRRAAPRRFRIHQHPTTTNAPRADSCDTKTPCSSVFRFVFHFVFRSSRISSSVSSSIDALTVSAPLFDSCMSRFAHDLIKLMTHSDEN
jgi:hypothetical protein